MFYSHQDDADYHFNAQFDYNAEAYGATKRDADLAAEQDSRPDGYIDDVQTALGFMFGGNATFTIVSLKTHDRYTFRMRSKNDGAVFFASTLIGANNEDDYAYLGYIGGHTSDELKAGKSGDANDVRFKGLAYVIRKLKAGTFPVDIQLWHEGRCGRCNRKLTDPVSIALGLGPECAGKV